MTYDAIDPIINAWVFLHDLKLFTMSRDDQVRHADVGKYTISIMEPTSKNEVQVNLIHATNPMKTKKVFTDIENLRETLENLYDIAEKT